MVTTTVCGDGGTQCLVVEFTAIDIFYPLVSDSYSNSDINYAIISKHVVTIYPN